MIAHYQAIPNYTSGRRRLDNKHLPIDWNLFIDWLMDSHSLSSHVKQSKRVGVIGKPAYWMWLYRCDQIMPSSHGSSHFWTQFSLGIHNPLGASSTSLTIVKLPSNSISLKISFNLKWSEWVPKVLYSGSYQILFGIFLSHFYHPRRWSAIKRQINPENVFFVFRLRKNERRGAFLGGWRGLFIWKYR